MAVTECGHSLIPEADVEEGAKCHQQWLCYMSDPVSSACHKAKPLGLAQVIWALLHLLPLEWRVKASVVWLFVLK